MSDIERKWTLKGARTTGAPMVVGGPMASTEPPPYLEPGELVEVVDARALNQLEGAVDALRQIALADPMHPPAQEVAERALDELGIDHFPPRGQ